MGNTPMQVLKGHRKRVRCLAFSPDGNLLASAAGKGHAISLWDARSGKRLRFLSWHDSTLASLTFSPCGDLLASTDSQGHYQLWDIPSGEPRSSIPPAGGPWHTGRLCPRSARRF